MPTIMDTEIAFDILSQERTGFKVRYREAPTNLSIEFMNRKGLKGDVKPTFSAVADGSIITMFDKTPFPKEKNDVVCPHFVELKWANGCNFDCSWCYLNGTFRFRPMGKEPYLKDKTKIVKHLENYFKQNRKPTLLNSGELSDSLVFEGKRDSLSNLIIPLFKQQDTHKLLILTKSVNVKGILESRAQDHVIVSFSLNSFDGAKRWEKKAPTPRQRIHAAKKLADAGYEVRVRIDPIVPIENWEESYKKMIDYMFKRFRPERITIGSLRGLQSTINKSKDKSWVEYLDDTSNWGKKISFSRRLYMYRSILKHLDDFYEFDSVGLCKETVEMWEALNKEYTSIKCNCIL